MKSILTKWLFCMKNSIRANLGKQSRTVILATGISLVSLIGLADYLTGYEISVSALYLAPISLAAWYGGQISGFAVSVTGAASWLLADFRSGHSFSHPALPLGNAAVLLLSFFVVLQSWQGSEAPMRGRCGSSVSFAKRWTM